MNRLLRLLPSTPDAALTWAAALAGLAVLGLLAAAAAAFVLRRRPLIAALLVVPLVAGSAAAAGLRHWIIESAGRERLAVVKAMHQRPNDPWPRGTGHVPLGVIGAAGPAKGYLEPGGAFSPAVGSFGVSFWVVGKDGGPAMTSDDVPLAETSQAYLDEATPGVRAVTRAYQATWRAVAPGRTVLDLTAAAGAPVEVAIRGVGPAGGPLRNIRVEGETLVLNGRWRLQPVGSLKLVFVGRERGDWLTAEARPAQVSDPGGWAAARLRLPVGASARLIIVDGQVPAQPSVAQPTPRGRQVVLSGVDPRFAASLRAQVETLAQSQIEGEIAPGDPINYPLAWLRDGAYVLVAMARAGEVDRARRLARPFVEKDFFGGFGSEADAPGLALWALGEVSTAAADPAFDREIWPAVVRKAGLIQRMATAAGPVEADYAGPVVPQYRSRHDLRLVADPPRNGLIQGRMDWGRPIFYVNGVSHLGLEHAAAIARRLGHVDQARSWDEAAGRLRRAWRAAFASPAAAAERADDRTAISGLWPTELAEAAAFEALLERRWQARRDGAGGFRERPQWTYFDLAEAHQWLRLGRADRVWSTLDWYWRNQPAPGLYTQWEGAGEENSFGLWEGIRGWVRPGNVTPHYWASAEMLLLQMAMLAEVEGPPEARRLSIGAGVPGGWLTRPLAVSGVGTPVGPVAWTWDGRTVTVTAPARLPVRLGPGFPKGAPVRFQVSSEGRL